MADELEEVIEQVMNKWFGATATEPTNLTKAIVAAIRSRWPELGWPCRSADPGEVLWCERHIFNCCERHQGRCHLCHEPKPGPAPGEYITGVDPASPNGDFSVEVTMKREGDSMKVVKVKTLSADERGEDQEAIRLWRDK